ncbi:hypothetical protein CVS37_02455 [Burkholderia lata]|nr:hypothetical protein CVS37_02455 [Burkholderia lata]
MRGIIRVGDVHSHGGYVETGASNSDVMGRTPARVGDRCTCPLHGVEINLKCQTSSASHSM